MAKGKILLVDWHGDPDCRACGLRDAGWFVDVEFEDGAQAYRMVRTEMPDAVVIDLSSKPSHGRELARSLRDTKATREVSLIFLGGAEDKHAQISVLIPDAVFTIWDEIEAVLDTLSHPEER